MDLTYWHKQKSNEPLYPDIIWSRPESKNNAGKLAVIGGHSHGFGAPGVAYSQALKSQIGVCKVLLPDAVRKTVSYVLPDAEYAESNPSGSFSKKALDKLLRIADWSDGTLLAGDMGRNSETAVLLENFVQEYTGKLMITQDAADYFKSFPDLILNRPETALVISLAQLQRIFINSLSMTPITYGMNVLQLSEALHDFTKQSSLIILVKHHDLIFVASGGIVVTTDNRETPWRVVTATKACTYWIQHPNKPLEAISTSILEK